MVSSGAAQRCLWRELLSFSTPRHPADDLSRNLTTEVHIAKSNSLLLQYVYVCVCVRVPVALWTVCVRVCACSVHASHLPLFLHVRLTVCLMCPILCCCIMEVDDSHV